MLEKEVKNLKDQMSTIYSITNSKNKKWEATQTRIKTLREF